MHFAVRELGVNLVHHLNHVASRDLFRVIITRKIIHNMAKSALLSESSPKGAHGFANIRIRRKDFQVLGRWRPLFLWGIL